MKNYYVYWELNDNNWQVIEKGNSLIQVRPEDDFLTSLEGFRERMAESRGSKHTYFNIVSLNKVE